MEWGDLDMGNVPSWIGTVSLMLAFVIFFRESNERRRAQVNSVGVWWECEQSIDLPGQGDIDLSKMKYATMKIRNDSSLPIFVVRVEYEIVTNWLVADFAQADPNLDEDDLGYPGIWVQTPGRNLLRTYPAPFEVPPLSVIDARIGLGDLMDSMPDDAVCLALGSQGIRCVEKVSFISDNSGRKWQSGPSTKGVAKPVYRIHKSSKYFPSS